MDPELLIDTLRIEERQFAKFLYHLFTKLERKMSLDFTALNAAVANIGSQVSQLASDVSANSQAVQAEIAAVIVALQGVTGSNPADQASIDTATASLTSLQGTITDQDTAVQKSTSALVAETSSLPPPSNAPSVVTANSRKIVNTAGADMPQKSA